MIDIGPSTGELTALIAEDIRAMPDTAVVLRPTTVSTAGGWTPTYVQPTTQLMSAQILALFPSIAPGTTLCRLTASVLSGGSEQTAAAELASMMAYTMTMPPNTDVQPKDRVQIQGTTLEVISIKGSASWNLSDSASLMEVRR